jgi:hypothetical protein
MTKTYDKKIAIPFEPRRDQQTILNELKTTRFFTAVCHRRFGKTVIAVIWLILEALSGVPDFRGYYIAPNQKQAKRVVWNYFKKFLNNFGDMVKFNETELRIDFIGTGGSIYLAGSENIESLRGVYIDRAILDEVASWQNAQYAFFEVLYPAMSDRHGRAVIIGTVKGLDLFHEFYQMGLDKTFPEWGSKLYDVMSTGVFGESEIATMRRLMSPDAFEREYMCNFYAEIPDALVSAGELYEAVKREINHLQLKAFPEVWGFDVGYTGDPSKLARRRGPLLYPNTELKNKDSVYQARWLKAQIDIHKPAAVYIDAGYGEGVIAQLLDMGYGHVIHPVFFNNKSPMSSCVNMRSYMAVMFKSWLQTGTIPNDEDFIKQASNILLDDTDLNRRVKLQPKKKIKEVLGRSPDDLDAVFLTMAGGCEETLDPATRVRNMAPGKVTPEDMREVLGIEDYNTKNPDEYFESLLDGFDNSLDSLDKMW